MMYNRIHCVRNYFLNKIKILKSEWFSVADSRTVCFTGEVHY